MTVIVAEVGASKVGDAEACDCPNRSEQNRQGHHARYRRGQLFGCCRGDDHQRNDQDRPDCVERCRYGQRHQEHKRDRQHAHWHTDAARELAIKRGREKLRVEKTNHSHVEYEHGKHDVEVHRPDLHPAEAELVPRGQVQVPDEHRVRIQVHVREVRGNQDHAHAEQCGEDKPLRRVTNHQARIPEPLGAEDHQHARQRGTHDHHRRVQVVRK